jgi:NAD-dependent DNA ligase
MNQEMKSINKNIRSLKNALREIKSIEIEDYILATGLQVQGVGSSFKDHLYESQFQLEVILNDLEEKYQVTHRIGAHDE